MAMQRLIAIGLLVAGVVVLFGVGWGLLVAGGLLWVRDDRVGVRVGVRLRGLQGWLVRSWGRARQAPRHALAGSMMGAGAVTAPTGALVMAGAGAALVVLAVVLLGLSLLLGWGA